MFLLQTQIHQWVPLPKACVQNRYSSSRILNNAHYEQAAGHPKDIPDSNGHFCKVLSSSLPTKLERTEITVSTVLGLPIEDPCPADWAAVFCSSWVSQVVFSVQPCWESFPMPQPKRIKKDTAVARSLLQNKVHKQSIEINVAPLILWAEYIQIRPEAQKSKTFPQ